MKKLFSLICCCIIFLVLSTSKTHALSCAVPQVNDKVIEGALIIFEGILKSSRGLSNFEKLKFTVADLHQMGGALKDLKVYTFRITKAWKGAKQGQDVQVLRNTYWGRGFLEETKYLVVSSEKYGELYFSHLCGPTFDLQNPEQPWVKTSMDNLRQYFAEKKVGVDK